MKRPLFLFSIFLILGIITAFLTNSYVLVILTFSPFLFITIILFLKCPDNRFILIGIIIFYLVGAFEYLYIDNLNTGKFKEFENQQVKVEGVIDSEPDIRAATVTYVVKTKEISTLDRTRKIDGKIMFTTLKSSYSYIYKYGSSIEISGQLSLPKSASNPGGFDYRRYLAQSGISANIFAKSDNILVGNVEHPNWIQLSGIFIRNRIIGVINKSLPAEQASLLNGMLIGYTADMDKDLQKDFSNAGLSHIMAVSGMNIAFIVFPMIFILKKIRVSKRIANIIVILTLIVFCFVTGFTPSVLRASIMAVTILIGQIMLRETDVLTSISFAAILILLFNPYTLFNVGFQLSFAATLSLILFYKSIKDYLDFKFLPKLISDVLSATMAAQVGVLPLIAIYFNKISLISVFTNLLVVPLVEMVTILGFVMAILGQISIFISQIIGYINSTFLTFILQVTKISSSIPYSMIKVTTPSILYIAIYYAFILFFLWYKPKMTFKIKYRYLLAGLSLIAALVIVINLLIPKGLEVVFIDVGEGDSAFIRTYTGKTVLIDGGGKSQTTADQPNIGDTIVIPFLLNYGVSSLDMVICTHGHADHMQGLIPVLKDLEVDNLLLPRSEDNEQFKELLDISAAKKIPTRFCTKGDIVRLDSKTVLKILYPIQDIPTNNSSLNESSLVLKLSYKNVGILFTGDIDSPVEDELISQHADLKADVLKVAHHGSIYSSSKDFLDLVRPKAAVISVGKNNYGHPSSSVIERLVQENAKVFRTDENGAVILSTDGDNIKMTKTLEH